MSLVSGDLRREITSLRDSLMNVFSFIEAAIDFPDDMGAEADILPLFSGIDAIISKVQSLISRYGEFNFLRDGLKVVIVGGPNVGKSSLMNRLINKERSIVTDLPGTTRDFIEDSFTANGVPIIVTDTAGIRDNPDAVEQIGIEKAWTIISEADVILFTLDAGKMIQLSDLSLFEKLSGKKIIIVINKTDLPDHQVRLLLPEAWVLTERIRVSALYNQGIDGLKEKLAQMSFCPEIRHEQKIVPNLRHKQCLENALQSLTDARNGILRPLPFEMISVDLKSAIDNLSEITGEIIKPDILDAIFSRFCIGK
jgi:tRNA modification GTPase